MPPLTESDRIERLEARLTYLEKRLGIARATYVPEPDDLLPYTPILLPHAPLRQATKKIPSEPAQPGKWLAYVAVLCFVFAAVFMVKLSIDSGWLTPVRQLATAGIFGFSLIGAGLWVTKIDRAYAAFLPGAGVIVLYLTTLAAHMYYGYLTPLSTLAILYAVSMICIWLYTEVRSEVYPVIAAVGSYLAPVILGSGVAVVAEGTGLFTLSYLLVCSCAFALLSIMLNTRLLTFIAAALGILLTATIGDATGAITASGFLALQAMVFVLATYAFSVRTGKALTEAEAWCFFPILLIFYAAEYHFLGNLYPAIAPWLALCFAGFLLVVYLWARQSFRQRLESHAPLAVFVSLVAFHAGYLVLMPQEWKPWLLPLVLFAYALSPSGNRSLLSGLAFTVPAMLVMTILGIEYWGTVSGLILDDGNPSTLVVGLATVAGVFALRMSGKSTATSPYAGIVLMLAHVMAVSALAQIAEGSLAVTALWLAYAIGVMVWGIQRRDEQLATSALVVLGLAAGKALLVDAASAPTIVRILCLLLTGIALYGSGLVLRRVRLLARAG